VEGGISFLAADYDLLYRWLCRWMERSGECCAAVLLACVPGEISGWVSIRREELSTTAYGPGGFGGTSRVKGA